MRVIVSHWLMEGHHEDDGGSAEVVRREGVKEVRQGIATYVATHAVSVGEPV